MVINISNLTKSDYSKFVIILASLAESELYCDYISFRHSLYISVIQHPLSPGHNLHEGKNFFN